jgi:hypothetical protein
VAALDSLRRNTVTSCGCKRTIHVRQLNQTKKTHGMGESKVYKVWQAMINRCVNPNSAAYKNYGGRGISVCDDWKVFENFLRDMGEPPTGLTLDRIDNNQGYCKSNCRWITQKEQTRNMRVNRLITFQGESKTIGEWSEITGINKDTIKSRLDLLGWTVERALTVIPG